MRTTSWLTRTRLVGAALALAAVATVRAVAGPPWIAIEYPVNPYDAATRDAFLTVRTYHHGTEVGLPVSGRAEGIASGTRRTIALRFDSTSHTGVVALKKQWPSDGAWLLVIEAAQGPDDKVTALVELSRDGTVHQVRVPTRRSGQWMLPQKVSGPDVEAALREMAARAN